MEVADHGNNVGTGAIVGMVAGFVVDIIVLTKFFGDPDHGSSGSSGRTKSGMFPSLY